MADIGDHRKLDGDHDEGDRGRGPEVGNDVGQRVAEAADRGHRACHRAAHDRRAAAGERAVVGERLGEGHGDAGADRGGEADQERRPGVVGGEGRREQRRERRDRAIHQAGEARLHVLQHEHAARSLVLLGAGRLGEDLLAELLGEVLVRRFLLGETVEEFAHRGVAGGACGRAVEARGLVFHVLRIFAHLGEAERAHEPERPVLHEALHVLAPNQREVFAEFRSIEVEQHRAVAHLLVRHLVEDLGGGRISLAQPFRESAIDAVVLLLVADREREDFLLAEIAEPLRRRVKE